MTKHSGEPQRSTRAEEFGQQAMEGPGRLLPGV